MKESDVRKLRDAIYGVGSKKNWSACKSIWMQPDNIKWLIENQPKKP